MLIDNISGGWAESSLFCLFFELDEVDFLAVDIADVDELDAMTCEGRDVGFHFGWKMMMPISRDEEVSDAMGDCL